jgi:hypothetical protein
MIAGGFVFGVPFAFILGILSAMAISLVGAPAMTDPGVDPLLPGAVNLLVYLMLAAFMPLMMGYTVKLYRALQKTR